MKILFKFQINRMKIDNFTNSAYVDLASTIDQQSQGRYLQSLKVSERSAERFGLKVSGQPNKLKITQTVSRVTLGETE